MIDRLIRGTAALTAVVAAVGSGAFFYVYSPGGATSARELIQRYTDQTLSSSPLVALLAQVALALAGVAVLLWVAGKVSAMYGSRRAAARAGQDPISSRPATAAERARVQLSLFEKIRHRVEHLSGDSEADMIMLVDEILRGAVLLSASDVHLTSTAKDQTLAYRMDGVLERVCSIGAEHRAMLVSRIRVLSRLDTTHHDVPQDGRLEINKTGVSAEFRVSILPTSHGPKVVMRVVRSSTEARRADDLGMSEAVLKQFLDLVGSPQGMIFLTGPTGSGKTTTIYSGLNHIFLKRGDVTNIVTIEDPIEVMLPFLTQTQVNEKVGLTFAKGLRSMLRQDPDVIMVGEIRDSETSGIAVQAGLTGHLILTTVHTNSAAGVFNRLIETGVEPFLLASAALGVVSQRLVRRLCPACRRPAPPTPDEAEKLRQLDVDVRGDQYFVATGCEDCSFRGYAGRIPLFELLPVTPAISDLINASVPTPQIHAAAVAEGMTVLLKDGIWKARNGITTLSEVLRVAGS